MTNPGCDGKKYMIFDSILSRPSACMSQCSGAGGGGGGRGVVGPGEVEPCRVRAVG